MNFSMSNENIRTLICGGRPISYVLTRKSVKNVNLRIKPDGIVYISASRRVPLKFIEEFIREKSDFIFTNLDKFAARKAAPELPEENKIFRNGDTLRYFGADYTLSIILSNKKEETVLINGREITVKTSSEERTGLLLKKFYAAETAKLFETMNRRTCLMFRAKGYDVPMAELNIRKMTSRWGSCHYSDGKIVMNSRLALYPDICAAYVFVHEYAHFIVPNHSADFYAAVADIMPDYKICKRMLAG